jgi:hypothetical protein
MSNSRVKTKALTLKFLFIRNKRNSSGTIEKFIPIHPDEEFCMENSSG